MLTKNVIEGLQILQKYRDNPDRDYLTARNDVLYLLPTTEKLSDDDLVRILELGWYQDHDGWDGDQDFVVSDYRPEESWEYHA